MKVKELMILLSKEDPEARVEMEIDIHGDRSEVIKIQPTIYNKTSNKWVVLLGHG